MTRRQIAYRFVYATIAAALLSGCGPKDTPATGTGQALVAKGGSGGFIGENGLVAPAEKGTAKGAEKKTFTRDELNKWLKDSTALRRGGWKPDEVKAKFGKPDATFERKASGVETVTYWEYSGLTVDAAGSEMVDRITRIAFTSGGTEWSKTEFVP